MIDRKDVEQEVLREVEAFLKFKTSTLTGFVNQLEKIFAMDERIRHLQRDYDECVRTSQRKNGEIEEYENLFCDRHLDSIPNPDAPMCPYCTIESDQERIRQAEENLKIISNALETEILANDRACKQAEARGREAMREEAALWNKAHRLLVACLAKHVGECYCDLCEEAGLASKAAIRALPMEPTETATKVPSFRGRCENGHEKGQRGCILCEDLI